MPTASKDSCSELLAVLSSNLWQPCRVRGCTSPFHSAVTEAPGLWGTPGLPPPAAPPSLLLLTPSPSLSERCTCPARPAAAHLENHDVILQPQGVEAVFKDPLDPEHLPGSLPPPQVMRPQHHAHRSKVPGVGGRTRSDVGAPGMGRGGETQQGRRRTLQTLALLPEAPTLGRPHAPRAGTRCVLARRHSQAVQTMRCRQDEVARDEGGAAEVASAPLQRSYEGPGVRPGRPAPHDLRGQRGAWGHRRGWGGKRRRNPNPWDPPRTPPGWAPLLLVIQRGEGACAVLLPWRSQT